MTNIILSRRSALLSLAAAPALAACASGPIADASTFIPTYPRTKLLIEAWVRDQRLPSAVVVVKTLNSPATTLTAGAVEFGADQGADESTIYRAYSMTKPVTGLAAMLCIEDGKFTLDTPLADILPEFRDMRVMNGDDPADTRPAAGPILVRHLLTHTSGLSYHILGEGALPRLYRQHGLFAAGRAITLHAGDGEPAPTLDEFASRLSRLPLSFDPGARWQYSVGLDVMGLVIQRTQNQKFEDFLSRRILAPLRMSDTAFYVPPEKLARFTTNYWRAEDRLIDIDNRASSPFANRDGVNYGGSGLVTTAYDYARYAQMMEQEGALDGVRIARRETVRAAASNMLPEGFDSAHSQLQGAEFGAGVAIATAASARPAERPPGSYSWAGAAGTLFWVDPASQIEVTFMTQVMNEDSRIWSPLQQAVYADIAAMPQLRREPVDTVSRPRRYY